MSPSAFTPPARVGCSACPGSENNTPGSKTSLPIYVHGSASLGRPLGRRSLDAFSSIRGSFRGRRALQPTTNQKPATPTMSTSAGNSPIGPPAKQRWYESLRGRSSQIPTPSSPASMSSTLKRSRFFRSSPTRLALDGPSPPTASQTGQTGTIRDPLPKLQIASFQSELQRLSMFGETTERSFADAGKNFAQHHSLAFLPRH